ncbi:MAG: DNA repair protein RadA [Defluviitaleaceae bacterium]|nr:DNA repair protein RadA [Defluviitaleaceae bacterium]MCL2274155.1 DNA repair protein RadA [Defluviitaleaceae bacterium]
MPAKTLFECNSCGYETAKWLGRCPSCNQFNTMEERAVRPAPAKTAGGLAAFSASSTVKKVRSSKNALSGASLLRDIPLNASARDARQPTGIQELDRVLGGGLVNGSLLLLGGDPGIGKSTLLLQMCRQMASEAFPILYVSGEESPSQIKLRAKRLKVDPAHLYFLAETDLHAIQEAVEKIKPALLLIDSIQTMRLSELSSLPGSVTQVRECTAFFTQIAKVRQTAVLLVGHVTKEGAIAGPRVLEHMVDCVLYFEGEGRDSYRVIRAVKNRFGSTHEIGVFEMGEHGLTAIADPSAYMLAGRPIGVSGSAVTCSLEGSRPLLLEVQGLVSHTHFGTPRRTANGMDYNRMVMLMAVLEKRANYKLATYDSYVNIAGGLRIDEPAADAAVIAAVASCYKNKALDPAYLVLGEVGLAGELRAVNQPERRMIEAARQGFAACVLPSANKKGIKAPEGMRVFGASHIGELLGLLL